MRQRAWGVMKALPLVADKALLKVMNVAQHLLAVGADEFGCC